MNCIENKLNAFETKLAPRYAHALARCGEGGLAGQRFAAERRVICELAANLIARYPSALKEERSRKDEVIEMILADEGLSCAAEVVGLSGDIDAFPVGVHAPLA